MTAVRCGESGHNGTEFHIGRIDMVANLDTYLDSPFHRFEDGKDLSELPLNSLAGLESVLIHANDIGRPSRASQTG